MCNGRVRDNVEVDTRPRVSVQLPPKVGWGHALEGHDAEEGDGDHPDDDEVGVDDPAVNFVESETEEQETDRGPDRQRDWGVKDFADVPGSERDGGLVDRKFCDVLSCGTIGDAVEGDATVCCVTELRDVHVSGK